MWRRSKAAPARYRTPEIFNIDQGSQFIGCDFIGAVEAARIKISRNGRGRQWMDNAFIVRLCRSSKHEDVYLIGYVDRREAKAGLWSWILF